MLSLLIAGLFAAAFCLAIAAIAEGWQCYGQAALALRQQLAACDPLRELRFVTITTHVRQETAEVWRLGFRPLAGQTQTHRPPRLILLSGLHSGLRPRLLDAA